MTDVSDAPRACPPLGGNAGALVTYTIEGVAASYSWPAEAEAIAGDRYNAQNQDDFSFVGTPQQVIAQMQPFIALGVDSFLLDCGGFPNLTTLELLVHEVLPVIAKATA